MQEIIKYEIYQTDADYKFFDYKFALKHNFKFDDYKKVYSNEISVGDESNYGAVAELLFMVFNSNKRPNDYNGRSMSVSDIIKINNYFYYCDDFGFNKLDF